MSELKVEVPKYIKDEVSRHSEVRWSEVVEKAIKKELEERASRKLIRFAMDKILENSTLTEEDCLRLGEEVKEAVWERYRKEGW